MSEPTVEDFGGVLAAPPRRPWRLMIAVAVAALAAASVAAGVVIVSAKPAGSHARNPVAIIMDPRGGKGASAGAFSPDGKTLAVGDGNGNVYLWGVASRRVTATLAQPVDPLQCNGEYNQPQEDGYGLVEPDGGPLGARVAFSPDGKFLATDVNCGRGVYLWDAARPRVPITLAGPSFDYYATPVVFSPDGATVANFNGVTRVWRAG